MSPTIHLDEKLIERCNTFARQLVADYAGGKNERSRSVSSHGAEANAELQARAKMAETAFAIWAGLVNQINWETRRPDGGSDFVLPISGIRVDIKNTSIRGQFLIWPLRKNELYEDKQFDVLVLIKGDRNVFEIAGWISKWAFNKSKMIADDQHKLTAGTWYVHASALTEPRRLLQLRHAPGFVGYDGGLFEHYCPCGKWATHGFNVQLRKDKLGTWYCGEHVPQELRQ